MSKSKQIKKPKSIKEIKEEANRIMWSMPTKKELVKAFIVILIFAAYKFSKS